jgi:phage gp36-like protein
VTYSTVQDLVERFGELEMIQLTDRTNSTGAIVEAVAERALRDATAEIDGYLAARYALPLVSVPSILVRVNADIARYYLYDDHAPELVSQRYKSAVDWLQRVSEGKVSPGIAEDGSAPETSDGAEMQSGGRVWDRNSSTGFI